MGEYPLLRVLLLAVPLLQRVTFGKRPKSNQKVCALTFGPLAGARGSFAPGSIRGHRFRFASLHLLSMCSTSSNGAARLPPDQSLHSACRRAPRSKAGELTLGLLSGEERVFGFSFVVDLPLIGTPPAQPSPYGRSEVSGGLG
ncbi:hypothetical protein EMIT0P265_110050 [Pseudomonas zeae]